MKITKGFKGFNKDFKCRNFQYEVGKEYEMEGKPQACAHGFHFCEHPLNVFDYYAPNQSKFAEVEGHGEVDREKNGDTKVATSKIKIVAEIGFKGLIEAAVKFVFERADWSKKENVATGSKGAASATGDQGAASATGSKGAALATGDQGAALATGYQGAALATGDQGAAISIGIEGKAKAMKGGFLVLAEWEMDKECNWHRKSIKSFVVDGKKVKEDQYYILKKGKLVKA